MSDAKAIELDAQYRQLREECGLLDRSARGKLLVSGPEATEFLQGQLTNEVEGLAPGEGRYAAQLDRKGHIQSDMRALRLAVEQIWLDTEQEALERLRRHLETYKIGRQVEIADLTSRRAILSLIGPRSAELAGTAVLPEHTSEATSVAGVECLAVGTSNGIDLIVGTGDREPKDLADGVGRLREGLIDLSAVEIGMGAAEVLRIESGRPRFGVEMGPGTMPAEAGIVERAIDFAKGCYIGQEPVARLHYRGRPNRRLRGLELSAAAGPGAALRLDGKEVGRLASACVSPALGPIGLALVRREAETGAELAVGEDGVTARVVDLPFG